MPDDLTAKAAEIVREVRGANGESDFSDDALALAFSDRHEGQILYVPVWRCWLRWNGCRWVRDETLTVWDMARKLLREKAAGADKEAVAVASEGKRVAVEKMARSDPRHARRPDQFDADPWALNTPAGVVNLKTGKMRRHDADDLHTKVTGEAPGGECARWLRFLEEVTQGDADLIAYLQRWAGYTLTGDIREHGFLFMWGPGGNGKSLFLSTLAAALGGYAVTSMADVFTVTRNEQHPTHVASLQGARMVVVSETEEGKPWAESRIKSLTGGDVVSARVMRGDPFEFRPQFKLWFAGNHRPVLQNPGRAMQRRLHLVPLTFVPQPKDLALPDKLKSELGGILKWAIEGCLAWQREGLGMPEAVKAAGADYFAEQDSVANWFTERCEQVKGSQTLSRALFQDWAAWARARGEEPGTEKGFSQRLQEHAAKKPTKRGAAFQGIRLRLPDPDDWTTPQGDGW